jgi:hypothetical protein
MADQKVTVILVNGELQIGTAVSRNGQEKIKFKNATGSNGVTIEFVDSPFEGGNKIGPIDDKKSEMSGKLKDGVPYGTYKYTVKLPKYPDLDPNVVVEP